MARPVMVVDDNPDDIEITRCILEEIDPGLPFLAASSGSEALDALRERAELPGLILVDLKMPGMEGTEVVRQLRDDARLRPIPAILVSHSRLETDRARCLAAGADEFLHKDFDLNRMTLTLRRTIDRWFQH
jgi:CheY-like chemotaxis protein